MVQRVPSSDRELQTAFFATATGPNSPTAVIIPALIGFREDVFNTGWNMVMVLNAGTPGVAPEGETRAVANYVSASGTFTVAAFSNDVEAGDVMMLVRADVSSAAILAAIAAHDADIKALIGAPAGASVSADIATANTNIGDPSGFTLTSIAALFGDLARNLKSILGTRWDAAGSLGADIASLLTSAGRPIYSYSEESEVQALVTITGGSTDISLPSVTLPNLTIGTIVRVLCYLKFREIEDTSGADNAINGAADMQVKETVGGAFTDCLDITDNSMDTDGSTRSGGYMIIGDIDVSGEVDAMNDTYDFQFDDIQADGANLLLHDVQTGIIVLYTVQ